MNPPPLLLHRLLQGPLRDWGRVGGRGDGGCGVEEQSPECVRHHRLLGPHVVL